MKWFFLFAVVVLSWEYSPALLSAGLIRFNVWESQDLVVWQVATNVSGTSVELTTETGPRFFRVEAVK